MSLRLNVAPGPVPARPQKATKIDSTIEVVRLQLPAEKWYLTPLSVTAGLIFTSVIPKVHKVENVLGPHAGWASWWRLRQAGEIIAISKVSRKDAGMVNAVLFDLANTLLNFRELQLNPLFIEGSKDSYRHLQTLGLPLPDFKRYSKAHLRAFQRRFIWSRICRRDFDCMDVMVRVLDHLNIQLPRQEYQNLAWIWYGPAARRSHVDRGTCEVLSNLRRQGIKLAIISNTLAPACCLDRHLQEEGLLEYFPIRIYSSITRYRKPHREIFRLALHELRVEPEEAIFIGDLLKTDVRGAQRAGMTAIWKPADNQSRTKSRSAGAHHVIRNIADLQHILPEMGVCQWAAA